MNTKQHNQTPKHGRLALACASLLAIFTATSSQAASGTWTSTASGNWSAAANWAGGTVANGSDGSADTAFFNTLDLTADVTVTLDTARTNANMVFADVNTNTPANWILSGSQLTLGSSTPTITVTNIAPGKSVTIGCILAGRNGLTVLGNNDNSVLNLTGANTFTNLTINGATVNETATTSLGLNASNNVVTLTNGATLTRSANISPLQTLNVQGTNTYQNVSGAGGNLNGMFIGGGTLLMNLNGIQITTGGGLTPNSNTWSGFTGTVILNGGGNLRFDVNNALTFTFGSKFATFNLGTTNNTLNERGATGIAVHTTYLGALLGGTNTAMSTSGTAGTTNTFQIGDANLSTTFNGKINNGSGVYTAVTKSGSGTLTLDNANGYSGVTLIQNGALALGTNGTTTGSLNNTPIITLASNATFDVSALSGAWTLTGSQSLLGYGSVAGSVTNLNAGIISPGAGNNTFGTLTFANGLGLNTGPTSVFKAGSGTNDQISVAGNLALSGTSVVNVTPANGNSVIPNGTYPIFKWSGSLTGDTNNLTLTYSAQPGTLVLVTNLTAKTISLVVSGASVNNLTWKGDGVNNFWDHESDNWLNGSTPSTFTELDNVTFNDAGSTNPAIVLDEVVNPSSVVFNNTNKNYTLISSGGQISGLTGLTKNGPGTVILDENNNYSGATTINAGALQVGNNDTSGTLGTGSLVNNGTLVFDRVDTVTLASALNGSGTLVQNGTNGILVLTADNANGGGMLVNAGTLQLGDGTSIHGSTTSQVTNNANGTLHYYYNADATIANTLSGNGTALYDSSTGNHTFTIPTTTINSNFFGTNIIDAGVRLHCSDGNLGHPLGNGGVVVVNSFGQVWLDRTAATYNQAFYIAGTGWPGTTAAAGSSALSVFGCTVNGPGIYLQADSRIGGTISGGTILCPISGSYQLEVWGTAGSYVLQLGPTNGVNNYGSTLITSGSILALNTNALSPGPLAMDLAGDLRLNGHNLTVSNLSSVNNQNFTNSGPTIQNIGSTNATLTVGADNTSTEFDGYFLNGGTGSLGLTKAGTGTLTLTGVSSNTGPVTVTGGTLALSGAGSFGAATEIDAASGASFDVAATGNPLILNSGQTLTGGGTVNGSVSASAGSIINPGDGIGALTITGNATLAGGLVMELNRTNSPATNDSLIVSGTLTAGGTLTVKNLGPALHAGDKFNLFTGPVTGFSATYLPVTDANGYGYTWINNIGVDGSIQVATAGPAVANFLFRSVTNGNWSDPGTWQQSTNGVNWVAAVGTPDYTASNTLIQTGTTVTNLVAVTVDHVTVQTNATVWLTTGNLNLTNSTAAVDFLVGGTVNIGAGGGLINNSASAVLVFTNGGAYVWNNAVTPAIPTATWQNGSTCRISAMATGYATGISGQSFYDFIWDTTLAGQASRGRLNISGTNTVIRRNFTIAIPDTTGASVTINAAPNGLLTVGGNVSLTGGLSSTGTKILLNDGSGETNFFKVAGNFTATGYLDGFGSALTTFDFNGTGPQSLTLPASAFLLTPTAMNWQVEAGSSVVLASSIQAFNNFTNNGTLTFGANTISGGTTLALNSSGIVNGDGTNQLVSGMSNLVNGGTLNLTNSVSLPTLAGGTSFTLFGASSYSGTFGSLLPSTPGGGNSWVTTQLNTAGILAVSGGVNTNPPQLQATVNGNTLSLAWPTNAGWTLLTNSVGLTATNQWFPYPNSANLTNVNITVNPANNNVFFRMAYPYP